MLDGVLSAEAEVLRDVLSACPVVSLEAGASRLGRSLDNWSLIAVEYGVVTLCNARTPRNGLVLLDLGPGAVTPAPRGESTVRALVDSCLTVVPDTVCGQLMALPALSRLVLERLEATVRKAELAIENVAGTRSLEARLRQKLVELAREYGRVGKTGIRIDLPLTHELLAGMTGARRESVTRALAELVRTGFLVREGRSYRLTGCEAETLLLRD